MKYTVLGLYILFSGLCVKAQNSKSYTIQAGGNILEVVPKTEMYEYASFQPGMVTFKTGINSQARAIINKKKIGGYGLRTDGGADSYGSFAVPGSNQANFNFVPNVETIVAYRRALYIGNQFNQFLPVTRKNIFSFYPEKEKKLKDYLDKAKVNFTSREDLIQLLAYMEN